MNIVNAREKYLIELMGVQFHSSACGFIYTSRGMLTPWEYFGRLLEWAKQQPFWGHFVRDCIGDDNGMDGPLRWPISQCFLDPEAFAVILHAYLTGAIPTEETNVVS